MSRSLLPVHAAGGLSRREFCRAGGQLLGAASLASLGGCAAVLVRSVQPVDGRLELPFAQYPELTERDGTLRLQVPGDETPIYVLVTGPGEFAVLSPICTHLGCTVEIEGAVLVCPCHGSTYDLTGRVVRGPAERPLRRYPSRVTDAGVLIIDLPAGLARHG